MTMDNWQTLDVITDRGVPFRVVFTRAGVEGPNRFRHPADSDRASVEFFDRRRTAGFDLFGQFVANYHVSTLLDSWQSGGLALRGGITDWEVDADTMDVVRAWLAHLMGNGAL